MESSDDQKLWGQQYLRYLYAWNVLFQFHPTHLNHTLANSSMPLRPHYWCDSGRKDTLVDEHVNLKLSSMHITQRTSVEFAGKGLSYMYMIQTVRDDDSREQHRGWQACADIRAPEVNYGRMASTSLSSWFTTTCKFQKSFRCFNLKRVSVNQLDQNSFKHLRKKSIEWK